MRSSKIQGELWGAAAHDWATFQEPLHRPLWEAMLDATKVGQGTRCLDAGCGSGGASHLATQRGAQVKGLDASAALIDIAANARRPPNFGWAIWKTCPMTPRSLMSSWPPFLYNMRPFRLRHCTN